MKINIYIHNIYIYIYIYSARHSYHSDACDAWVLFPAFLMQNFLCDMIIKF